MCTIQIKKRWVMIGVTLVLALSLTSVGYAKVVRLKQNASPTTSGHYAAHVAMAGIINKYVPEVKVTVVENTVTHKGMIQLQHRMLDYGVVTTADALVMAYTGTVRDEYKKHGPWPELRIFLPGYHWMRWYVVIVDEGSCVAIETLEDLAGKRFSAGIPGSSLDFATPRAFKELGIEPDWVKGAFGDVVSMCKDLACCGFIKAGAGVQLDASMLDLQSMRKIKIIPWTDKQVEIAMKAIPGTMKYTVPAGAIKALPNAPAFTTWGSSINGFSTPALSQDLGYKMSKALGEHWNELVAAYPSAAEWKPGESDLKLWTMVQDMAGPGKIPPIHAGTVQYYEEKGYKVPADFIPPEYKK
jgi:TRAP transporter TAXI family solute receptor